MASVLPHVLNKVRKIRNAAILVGGLTLAASTGPSLVNDLYYELYPTQLRKEFKQEFGFPLRGWKKDIEDHPENIETLLLTLSKERHLHGDLDVDAITVVPQEFYKKGTYQKILSLLGVGGQNFFGNLLLSGDKETNTLGSYMVHHEFSHILFEANKSIAKEWPIQTYSHKAVDGYVSYYLFTPEDKIPDSIWLTSTKSFPNKISTMFLYEDFACTREKLLSNPDLSGYIFGLERKSNFEKKYETLLDFNLASKELVEYAYIQKLYEPLKELVKFNFKVTAEERDNIFCYVRESTDFMRKHQQSIHTPQILYNLGRICDLARKPELATPYYEQVLTTPFRDLSLMDKTLEHLNRLEPAEYRSKLHLYKDAKEKGNISALLYGKYTKD